MVSLTLKVILHVTENDSKYRDVAPLTKPHECRESVEIYSARDKITRPLSSILHNKRNSVSNHIPVGSSTITFVALYSIFFTYCYYNFNP